MSAMGASESDMLDPGGYVAGSQVMRQVYDYHSGAQGPLASNSNTGGTRPTTKDVRSWLPPHIEKWGATPSEILGGRGGATWPSNV